MRNKQFSWTVHQRQYRIRPTFTFQLTFTVLTFKLKVLGNIYHLYYLVLDLGNFIY